MFRLFILRSLININYCTTILLGTTIFYYSITLHGLITFLSLEPQSIHKKLLMLSMYAINIIQCILYQCTIIF